ncbi:phenylalanine--tRNA ligase, alpha subunit [Veillonellaceae bacterium DNF00751]|jgi:hypothetical protein|uniref:Phenylalanine--tRNA ligase alpha subunit n=2 Tax=Megasphaera lornae TaxID=1000568 RepID=D3LWR0_9FIRM|nr:phenylalanine--tRNA ligase, alpha subunit [Megasphaera genomosp. type_1 str. 28L]EGL40337.1 phenylalanine--tRNA ligase, alpha subunit [Megasphaera lornae]KXB89948.1 phenylalanine--tRNA ligase, alpha subunit [Veillonellaceae bacterium DNF00751]MUP49817.1 phenylalanine--tRNA ligase subunit alpha [Veillonellaceae bacterium M1-70]
MIQETIGAMQQAVQERLLHCRTAQDVQAVRVQYLGKKGELTALLKGMKNVPPAERPAFGQLVNAARSALEAKLQERQAEVEEQEMATRLQSETLDITLPSRQPVRGHMHPLHLTRRHMEEAFLRMGFSLVEGPEIETDYFNFQCLNFPPDHPARDMQDSMYLTDSLLLRTHTSPMQARVLQSHKPNEPVKVIVPGKVYRWDYDATHSPVFHQMEGLIVDRHIRFSDLKGMLEDFLREIFGASTKVRFRASYFPFTEPSAEVDISCVMCGGEGCRVCSHTGWLEILGCGMVHPNVLRLNGYDPEQVTGFAFGMGVERIAMLKYGIDDLRLFYENDMRFLTQF